MTNLPDFTIREVGNLVQRRETSAVEVLEATLTRIEETEPVIHAYALVLAENARQAALEADRAIAAGRRRGPLHGVPIGVKDLCYLKGMPVEAGSAAMKGFIAPYDAAVVERLREAGAIIIGKTVTHEFAYGVNVPLTRSPWLTDGYPGGSSAGSGAAVAARSAYGAIGTDTGGSIREPASLNGLVGLKPTFGLISRYGIVPLSASLDHAGPLTRTVQDCALLLQVLAGYDSRDAGSIEAEVPDYGANLERGVEGLTIGVERQLMDDPHLRPEVRTAVEAVAAELAGQGASVIEVAIPDLDLHGVAGLTILLPDASAYYRDVLREKGDLLDPATRVMFELGELVPADHYVIAQKARRVLRDGLRRLYEEHRLDAVLSPTLPTTTMPIDQVSQPDESGEDPLSAAIHFTIPANLTGQPAITIPCGLSSSGLPIGVQLMGRPFEESTLFRIAQTYERGHGWTELAPTNQQSP